MRYLQKNWKGKLSLKTNVEILKVKKKLKMHSGWVVVLSYSLSQTLQYCIINHVHIIIINILNAFYIFVWFNSYFLIFKLSSKPHC